MTELETRAQSLVTAGTAATFNEGIKIAASESPELYTDYLSTLSGKTLVTAVARTLQSTPSNGSESLFETCAKRLVTCGEAKTFDEACTILAAECPGAYKSYLATLS